MSKKDIASTILNQLGGRRFTVMTGSSGYIATENGLKMKLTRNKSRANCLEIVLTWANDYTMVFTKEVFPCTANRFRYESVEVCKVEGVFWTDLQGTFTRITGMNTRL